MQYYEAIDTDNQIAIIFQDDEIPLGFQIMEDLIQVVKVNGGTEAPDMRQWLNESKKKYNSPTQ